MRLRILALIAALLVGDSYARSAKRIEATSVGGVWAGESASTARKRLGKGYFSRREGQAGTGAYFYTDEHQTVTLRVELGTEHVVGEIRLSKGLRLPKGQKELPLNMVVSLDLAALVTREGVKLGDHEERIIKIYGRPTRRRAKKDGLILDYSIGDSPNFYGFRLKDGEVVELWAGSET